jgi:hypothetical protein
MELENRTPFPAGLYRGVIGEDRLCASLVVRQTFELNGEQLRPAGEQTWKVSPGPWEGPYGAMPGDELYYRGGVDVIVFGSARHPGGRAAPRGEVTVEVGDKFRHKIAVFGDRIWEKKQGRLLPSEPKPFTAIPLTLAHAFGGKDLWDELPIPYQDNPDGKGYYLEEANAVGKPLPNLENPGALVQRWNDQPEPVGVGVAPPGFGPRLKRSIELDPKTGLIAKLHATFFNAAFPSMVIPPEAAPAGARVRVSGVRAEGPLSFTLPRGGLRIRLQFGEQVSEVEPDLDQIGIEADVRRVFLAYRYPFRYRLIPLQKRGCELVAV